MKLLTKLNKEQLKHLALTLRILGGCCLGLVTQSSIQLVPLLLLGFAFCELLGAFLLGKIKEE